MKTVGAIDRVQTSLFYMYCLTCRSCRIVFKRVFIFYYFAVGGVMHELVMLEDAFPKTVLSLCIFKYLCFPVSPRRPGWPRELVPGPGHQEPAATGCCADATSWSRGRRPSGLGPSGGRCQGL